MRLDTNSHNFKLKIHGKKVLLILLLISTFTLLTPGIETAKAETSTLGKTAAGINSVNSDLNSVFGSHFLASADATVTRVSAYIYCTSSGLTKAVIYSDASGSPAMKLAESQEVEVGGDSPRWVDFAISLNIAHNSVYWLCLFSSRSITYYYDAGAGNQFASAFADYPNTPATFPTSATYSTYILSIYAGNSSTSTPAPSTTSTLTPTPSTSSLVTTPTPNPVITPSMSPSLTPSLTASYSQNPSSNLSPSPGSSPTPSPSIPESPLIAVFAVLVVSIFILGAVAKKRLRK